MRHEAARESVAGASRIDNHAFLGGKCRNNRHAVAMHQHRAMLALLHHDELRPVAKDPSTSADGVADAGQVRGLGVVENDAVDLGKQMHQFVVGDVDPKIHRVGDGELAIGNLIEQPRLHGRMGVAEEDKRAVGECRGNLRRSIGHHTELGEQRLALIHVEQVFPAPSKGFSALARFEAEQINLTERLELEAMLRGEGKMRLDMALNSALTAGAAMVAAATPPAAVMNFLRVTFILAPCQVEQRYLSRAKTSASSS